MIDLSDMDPTVDDLGLLRTFELVVPFNEGERLFPASIDE
jgi:hypothetical protein